MDVIEQEATEDFQLMAAMSPSEEAYLNTDVFTLAKQRLPWLLILMISATFTGRIMLKFESVLASGSYPKYLYTNVNGYRWKLRKSIFYF